MKSKFQMIRSVYFWVVLLLAAASCKKDNSATADTASASALSAAIASTQAVAVGSISSTSTSAADSVYVINTCLPGAQRDSVSSGSLPAAVSTYLTTNYSGYTFQKAFSIKNASGTVQGYVVIIQYNGNPVGLKFDASGDFLQVLEQRQGSDLIGRGWHEGGRFRHRDGSRTDTVAISALPAAISSYFTTHYPNDTLLAAFTNWDSSYIVLSKDNGMYAAAFSRSGIFITRAQLPQHHKGGITIIAQSALPASVSAYLTTTYPAYVFEKAFSVSDNGTLQGYVIVIDANNVKYAVAFDASGNFVAAKVIR